jgi:hypothetical protein
MFLSHTILSYGQFDYNSNIQNQICYDLLIGDFNCDNCSRSDNEQLRIGINVRNDIMEIITKYKHCSIVSRDRISDILSLADNEKAITSIRDLSQAQVEKIINVNRAKRALFGNIWQQDDGSLLVTLEIYNLQSTKVEGFKRFELAKDKYSIYSARMKDVEKALAELILGGANSAGPNDKIAQGNNNKEEKDRDETAWRQAQKIHSIDAYKSYQNDFPNGEHYAEAYQKINNIIRDEDDRAWNAAKNANTINAYQEYLSKYKDGMYASLANSKIEELKQSQSTFKFAPLLTMVLEPISNLKVNSNGSYSLQSNLQNGSKVYSDREYVWKDLPEYFKGAYFIITANEDKFINSDNLIEFTANQNIKVCIVYDPSYPQKPGWIYSFQKTTYNLYFMDAKNGSVSSAMLIHERTYNKGETVRLGGNYNPAANHNGAMYAVFIKPL